MYPPSAILAAAGLDPARVGRSCGLVELDRTPVRPAPRWLTTLWRGPVAAMTVPWAIYVRDDVLHGDTGTLAKLLGHELVHVRQWSDLGPVSFSRNYVGSYLAGRRRGLSHDEAYRAIPLEVEARQISGH